jgi:branched-chain amino acid transport system ATP-binding protein
MSAGSISLLEITMSTKSVLEVDQLEVRYGAIEAIKGISLHVNAGEIVTILAATVPAKAP